MNSNKEERIVHPAEQGFRTTLIGIVVSVILAVVKATAGVLGNSFALIADAVESIGDIFTAIVMFIGLKTSLRPADENHPYGHGKAEPIAALVVVLGLTIAAGFIAVESVRNINTPHNPPKAFTLWVLLLVITVKEVLSRHVSAVGANVESRAIQADGFHHRSDAITSGAAFIGIAIALIGGAGFEVADDWAALLASGIILFNAYHIGKPAFGELMDENPQVSWLEKAREAALSHPEVSSIEKLRVRKLGFDLYLDFHMRMDGNITVLKGHRIAHEVKDELMMLHPYMRDVLIHIEPDSPPERENL